MLQLSRFSKANYMFLLTLVSTKLFDKGKVSLTSKETTFLYAHFLHGLSVVFFLSKGCLFLATGIQSYMEVLTNAFSEHLRVQMCVGKCLQNVLKRLQMNLVPAIDCYTHGSPHGACMDVVGTWEVGWCKNCPSWPCGLLRLWYDGFKSARKHSGGAQMLCHQEHGKKSPSSSQTPFFLTGACPRPQVD